jgi:hypothetical protein
MSLTKTVGLFAGTTLLAGAAFGAGDSTNYQQEIADLRAEIASMKAQSGDNWLTEQRAAEIKGLVQDVLADADTRASLQGTGATAGFDNGFFLSSADGNFRLNVGGTASARFTYNNRQDSYNNANGTYDNNWGFAIRHTGLSFDGYMFDPSWKYGVSLAIYDETAIVPSSLNYQNGQVFLLDAYVMKDFGDFYVQAGQFKSAITRQGSLNLWDLQMVDMANVDYLFGTQWTQGIKFGFDNDMMRAHLTYSEGVGGNSPTLNSQFTDYNGGGNGSIGTASPQNQLAFDGRAEFKMGGTWAQFDDEQSWQGEEFGLLIGVGGYWQKGRVTPNTLAPVPPAPPASDANLGGESWGLTADVTADFGGFNIFGAFYYAGTNGYNQNPGTLAPIVSDSWGFQVQGGAFVSQDMEIAARYEYGDLRNGSAAPAESILSAGLNMYFSKNRVKWQSDVGYSFDSLTATSGVNNQGGGWAVSGTGWLPDNGTGTANGGGGEWLVRSQFTVTF